MDSDGIGDSIAYSISGDDKDVVYISAEVEKWILSIKTLSVASIHPVGQIGALALMWMVGLTMWLMGLLDAIGHSRLSIPRWFISVGLVLNVSAIVAPLIKKWIYPIGDIAIGDGVGRSARQRQMRSNLFWVVIVGCVVGVLVAIITKHLP